MTKFTVSPIPIFVTVFASSTPSTVACSTGAPEVIDAQSLDSSGDEREWALIEQDSLTSREIDEVAAYLLSSGQASA